MRKELRTFIYECDGPIGRGMTKLDPCQAAHSLLADSTSQADDRVQEEGWTQNAQFWFCPLHPAYGRPMDPEDPRLKGRRYR